MNKFLKLFSVVVTMASFSVLSGGCKVSSKSKETTQPPRGSLWTDKSSLEVLPHATLASLDDVPRALQLNVVIPFEATFPQILLENGRIKAQGESSSDYCIVRSDGNMLQQAAGTSLAIVTFEIENGGISIVLSNQRPEEISFIRCYYVNQGKSLANLTYAEFKAITGGAFIIRQDPGL